MAIRARITALLFGIALLFLLAACSGGDTGSENGDNENGGNNQSPSSSSSSSSSRSGSSPDACDAFGAAGGIPGLGGLGGILGNFSSSIAGGPTVDATFSESPPTPEAEQIGDFFENILDDVLDDVSADCYWVVTTTEGGEKASGFWISYSLSSPPSSQAGLDIQIALTTAGATSVGSFAGGTGADAAAMVMFGDLPLDIAGDTGGMLIIQNDFAILFAGTGDDFGGAPSAASIPLDSANPQGLASDSSSLGSSSDLPPTTTPTPTPVPLTQADFQNINDSLMADLEEALEISLEVQSTFSSGNTYIASYSIQEGGTVPSDTATILNDVVIARGGTVTSTMAFTGTFNVTFDGMQFDGISTSGNISVLAAQNVISVTLQN